MAYNVLLFSIEGRDLSELENELHSQLLAQSDSWFHQFWSRWMQRFFPMKVCSDDLRIVVRVPKAQLRRARTTLPKYLAFNAQQSRLGSAQPGSGSGLKIEVSDADEYSAHIYGNGERSSRDENRRSISTSKVGYEDMRKPILDAISELRTTVQPEDRFVITVLDPDAEPGIRAALPRAQLMINERLKDAQLLAAGAIPPKLTLRSYVEGTMPPWAYGESLLVEFIAASENVHTIPEGDTLPPNEILNDSDLTQGMHGNPYAAVSIALKSSDESWYRVALESGEYFRIDRQTLGQALTRIGGNKSLLSAGAGAAVVQLNEKGISIIAPGRNTFASGSLIKLGQQFSYPVTIQVRDQPYIDLDGTTTFPLLIKLERAHSEDYQGEIYD